MKSKITFTISDSNELKAIKMFKEKHCKKCTIYNREGFPVTPLFTYSFTPTGIADAIIIKCTFCGEEKNVTNYDVW